MSKSTINDISKIVGSGITPLRSNSEFWENPKYPWLKTEQLGEFQIFDTAEYISQTALDKTNIKLWPPQTLSVAMYGEGKTRGNVSIIMREMTTNQACCNIIVDENVADFRYVYYWLKSNYNQLRTLSSGVRKNLNSDDIKGFPISLPDLPLKQKELVDGLYAIDQKIQLNNRIITELESMAKTLYDYWFLQFDFPNTEGNPYRASGGEMVWSEQLKREIPKRWRTSKVGDLLDKVPNTSRVQSTEYLSSGGTPVIDQSKDYIAGYTNSPDAVMSISGGAIIFGDHTRIVKYVDFDFARGADGTQILISNNDCVPQLLLYHIINKIDLSNNGYARHYKFLKDVSVVIPEKEASVAFNKITTPLYKMITGKIFENLELAKLRDWLLPMLMNGQVTMK